MAMEFIQLSSGQSTLVVAPRSGSAIVNLTLAGQQVLRTVEDPAAVSAHAGDLGEFPMVPWVNRVAEGRFTWEGERVEFDAGAPHAERALHGIGWHRAWEVVDQSRDELVVEDRCEGRSGWPFRYAAVRRFYLSDDAVRVELMVQNTGAAPMPASGGFHPFFPAQGGVIRTNVSGAWLCDDRKIPNTWRAGYACDRLADGLSVQEMALDHCFTDWDGRADLIWPSHTVRLERSPGLRYLQIYTPSTGGFFCVEPQSAMPDALNRSPDESGLAVLQPGETLEMWMRLSISFPDDSLR